MNKRASVAPTVTILGKGDPQGQGLQQSLQVAQDQSLVTSWIALRSTEVVVPEKEKKGQRREEIPGRVESEYNLLFGKQSPKRTVRVVTATIR
ncbi:hypothetical protein IAQ61_003700 [Plenodomus lingam]|uniref:uncharacterized protein n=1 Tax=Leptosphaeria maculans TaxID=5022 RepID=UPI003326A152|nr:hypothetical protein IAQ61_003700 [Plenodomus lingam]